MSAYAHSNLQYHTKCVLKVIFALNSALRISSLQPSSHFSNLRVILAWRNQLYNFLSQYVYLMTTILWYSNVEKIVRRESCEQKDITCENASLHLCISYWRWTEVQFTELKLSEPHVTSTSICYRTSKSQLLLTLGTFSHLKKPTCCISIMCNFMPITVVIHAPLSFV